MNIKSLWAIFAFAFTLQAFGQSDTVTITTDDLRAIQKYFKKNPHATIMRVTASRDTADKYGLALYEDLENSISISFRRCAMADCSEHWTATTVISVDSASVESFFQGYDRNEVIGDIRPNISRPKRPVSLRVPAQKTEDMSFVKSLSLENRELIDQTIFRLFVMTKFLEDRPFETRLENHAFRTLCRLNESVESLLGENSELYLRDSPPSIRILFWTPRLDWEVLEFLLRTGTATIKRYESSGKEIVPDDRALVERLEALDAIHYP